jgi:hypothetical protein
MKQVRIPPLLADIVQSSIMMFDNITFDNRDVCPECGGSLSGYDIRKKQFAVMQREGKPCPVRVFVKRFYCRQCGIICFADEPYYPDTRFGSPVVDLCRTLSITMPFHCTTEYLAQMGIIIDRGTVRNYARRSFPKIPTTDLFGVRFPLSVVSLSSLAGTIGEGRCIPGAETLAACGFPSAYRAPPRFPGPEQGDKRNGEEHEKEGETQKPQDDSNPQ